jgi:hypothetical protein
VFPVRYDLHYYITLRRNLVFKGLTSVLDGGDQLSDSHPGRSNPRGKSSWYPFDKRLGQPQ